MTEPGQPCPVCGQPDPAHDWDVHERRAEGVGWTPSDALPEGARTAVNMLERSSSRGGARVRWLAVHSTEGIMRAADLRAWAAWPGSSHASADALGNLLEPDDGFVPYDRAAWTLRNGNPVSDNIELCALASWTRQQWLDRPRLLEQCAAWLASRSKARGIPLRKLTVAQVRAGEAGVIDHDDYTDATGDGTHWDVGEAFPWDVVIARARALASPPQPKPTPAPQPAPTPGGFMADLTDAEQREALELLRDLHYGLRRPLVLGVTLTGAVRELLGIARGMAVATPPGAVGAGWPTDEPLPWTDDDLERLGVDLRAQLDANQARLFLEAFANGRRA